MKRKALSFLWIILLVIPLVFVNEYTRTQKKEVSSYYKGVPAIHSALFTPEKCTWHCHHNTEYCKQHHVSFLKSSLKIIDPVYSGMISMLESTGNYRLANIIVFVVFWPLFMLALAIGIVRMHRKLNQNFQ